MMTEMMTERTTQSNFEQSWSELMSSQALQPRFQVDQIFKVGKLEKRPSPLQIRDEEHSMNNVSQWYANVLILSHYP